MCDVYCRCGDSYMYSFCSWWYSSLLSMLLSSREWFCWLSRLIWLRRWWFSSSRFPFNRLNSYVRKETTRWWSRLVLLRESCSLLLVSPLFTSQWLSSLVMVRSRPWCCSMSVSYRAIHRLTSSWAELNELLSSFIRCWSPSLCSDCCDWLSVNLKRGNKEKSERRCEWSALENFKSAVVQGLASDLGHTVPDLNHFSTTRSWCGDWYWTNTPLCYTCSYKGSHKKQTA